MRKFRTPTPHFRLVLRLTSNTSFLARGFAHFPSAETSGSYSISVNSHPSTPRYMLRRFNLFTHRGTAVKFTHSTSHPSPLPNKSFFASSSPKPNSRSYPRKSYLFGAVGGIVVAASVREEEEEKDMAPLDLPGRPGNLTDEQKLRLKEMWAIAFKVFGVDTPTPQPDIAGDTDSTPDVTRTETDLSDTKEKKGKLKGMFKKKKDRDASPSPALTPTSDVSADL